MTFQGYLNSIERNTGKTPEEFLKWGAEQGFSTENGLVQGIKVGAIVAALKEEFGLGHGHAMAIVALLKGKQP